MSHIVSREIAGRNLVVETGKLAGLVRENFGINCFIDLAPPRTLPRTSSGKLSRTRAKADFLARTSWSQDGFPEADLPAQALASG